MSEKNIAEKTGKGAIIGLTVFVAYVLVLAAAALSEFNNLDWFDHPIFK